MNLGEFKKHIESFPEGTLFNYTLSDMFEGWKGGDYRYNESTPIHFEAGPSDYSDGGYAEAIISNILGLGRVDSQEERLCKLIFNAE